jgi:hypothetical protein
VPDGDAPEVDACDVAPSSTVFDRFDIGTGAAARAASIARSLVAASMRSSSSGPSSFVASASVATGAAFHGALRDDANSLRMDASRDASAS